MLNVTETAAHKVTVSRTQVPAGVVSINMYVKVTNENFTLTLFTLKPGATMPQFMAHLRTVFTEGKTQAQRDAAAAGMRWIAAHVAAFGGNPGVPKSSMHLRTVLQPGTYYAADLQNRSIVPFKVTGSHSSATLPPAPQSVKMVLKGSDNQFAVSGGSPAGTLHNGVVRIQNLTGEFHFAEFLPVKPGVTNAQVQQALQQNKFGKVFEQGRPGGTDVISPGNSINLTLNLPPGRYAVLCFVPSDSTGPMAGMPHALMGMHAVFQVAGG